MKILLVAGTRPEVIKTVGLVFASRGRSDCDLIMCSSGQHRTMLDETFAAFDVKPDHDLEVMSEKPGLDTLTARLVERMTPLIAELAPDAVLVQGDTTTAMVGALSAYYNRVPVGHIEAGLRTNNMYSPWPEEGNRRLVGSLARWHFPPTTVAEANLLREGVDPASIMVTGNTVIDALLWTRDRISTGPAHEALAKQFSWLDASKRLVLVTGHRRENFGDGFRQICLALKQIAARGDVEILYPVHLNPNVKGPVHEMLADAPNVHLIAPQPYRAFVYLMTRAHLILTDSGGIQEEAPSLAKPVLVMRDTSERMEAIDAGAARLVGTNAGSIVNEATRLLDDAAAYEAMASVRNPFGDGKASQRILDRLMESR